MPVSVLQVTMRAVGPFVPDVTLPEQLFPRLRPATPEMALMLRVLEQAFDDLRLRANGCESKWAADARAWFLSDSEEVCSFKYICALWGFDPAAIVQRLLRHGFRLAASAKVVARRGTLAAPTVSAVELAPRHRPRKRNNPHSPLWES